MDDKTRVNKVMEIFKKLKELNLGIENFEEFNHFRQICNEFIRNGNATNGRIKVFGTKRIICYNFDEKNVDCSLKYDETI
tara:strand:+ start:156 stop:395 length:240 start_codon:yes stop_codon:yes gene_type:complete